MFRARDSCGADVRRGRSPKCLFIKATATGNTINGLNDEINKLPRRGTAGHGRASAGRGTTAGQSPRPASKPGPSPALAALPAPLGPAWLQCHPHPTFALALRHPGTHNSPNYSARQSPCYASPQGLFLHHLRWALLLPHSLKLPKCATLVPNWESLIFFFFLRPGADLQAAPALSMGGPGGPLKVAVGGQFPHAHPLPGLSNQFPVSGKLCFP